MIGSLSHTGLIRVSTNNDCQASFMNLKGIFAFSFGWDPTTNTRYPPLNEIEKEYNYWPMRNLYMACMIVYSLTPFIHTM